jgi:starch synthase
MRSGSDRCRSVTRPAGWPRPSRQQTGFLISQPSTESVLGGIRRAFETFMAKDRLDSMRRSAMAQSFGWDLSAAYYSALYRKTVGA